MFSSEFEVGRKQAVKISWIGVGSIVFGILVIVFPNLISYLIGIALIVVVVLQVVRRAVASKGD